MIEESDEEDQYIEMDIVFKMYISDVKMYPFPVNWPENGSTHIK